MNIKKAVLLSSSLSSAVIAGIKVGKVLLELEQEH
jgi:hypothetical protein